MGFLQLIPATKLTATYDGEARTLLLQAQGQVQNYTSGIHFVFRGPTPGGFDTFQLLGWVGPIGPGTSPYDHLQRFENMDYPGAYVRIADAGHPDGTPVPVEVVPGAATSAAVPTEEVRRIAVGGALELSAAACVPPRATVSLERDPAFLALESAGIQNPSGGAEIVWSLRGLKPGETQVKIVYMGGINPLITVRTVKVIIGPAAAK
jgi:hypothetical protein